MAQHRCPELCRDTVFAEEDAATRCESVRALGGALPC